MRPGLEPGWRHQICASCVGARTRCSDDGVVNCVCVGVTAEIQDLNEHFLERVLASLKVLRESKNWASHPEVGNSRLRLIDGFERTLRDHGLIR